MRFIDDNPTHPSSIHEVMFRGRMLGCSLRKWNEHSQQYQSSAALPYDELLEVLANAGIIDRGSIATAPQVFDLETRELREGL